MIEEKIVKIYARDTRIEVLESTPVQEFLKVNHSQKNTKATGKILALGLYKADELVAVAQFASPRTAAMKRNYTTELLRMAFKKNTRIIGGGSKLIKNFISIFKPTDFFTYQDMSGEATDIYGHSGMTLVRQAKIKEYLIAPDCTLATAKKNEWFSMGQAVRFGPDKLLGGTLGEIFHDNGKRKTNPELFIEELGWHIEITPGDRVWEWIAPELTFYTYKITASDSAKYYYGISHLKKANATKDDCLNDGYYGSGGGTHGNNKFYNWKNKHHDSLNKEVLNLYDRKALAYINEKTLVGDFYKTDPNCLNSTTGGKDGGLNYIKSKASYKEAVCLIHGKVMHRGKSCIPCQIESMKSIKKCLTHGQALHFGNTCCKCSTSKIFTLEECIIHGETTFRGDFCTKCAYGDRLNEKECQVHGLTIFRDALCLTCVVNESIKLLKCPKHGECKHIGGACYRCISEGNNNINTCSIHGETIFIKTICLKCAQSGRDKLSTCTVHGETLHRGGKCLKCMNGARVSKAVCSIHGEQNFLSGKCYRCLNTKSVRVANCPVHGESKFQGTSCRKCAAQKSMHRRWHKEPREACDFC